MAGNQSTRKLGWPSLLHAWRRDALLSQTALMFLVTLGAYAANYFYQVFLGRTLGPAGYGLFGSLFAIAYLVSNVANAIQTSTARFVSQLHAQGEEGSIRFLFNRLFLQMVALAAFAFALVLLLSGIIGSFLHTSSALVVVAGVSVLLSIFWPVLQGTLQGLQRFRSFGLSIILNYTSKLVLGAAFVLAGLGVAGALWGVAIGFAVGVLVALLASRRLFARRPQDGFRLRQLYAYAFPATLASFCFAIPTTVDVIIAKHFLPELDAGYYTSGAVLGRIVYYVPIAVTYVIFPKIAQARAQGMPTMPLLGRGLFYAGALSGAVAALYWLFPTQVVGIVFGPSYTPAAPVASLYGLAMLFFALVMICAYYNLAVDNLRYTYLLTGFMAVQVVALLVFHRSPGQMAVVLVLTNLPLLLASLWYAIAVREHPQAATQSR